MNTSILTIGNEILDGRVQDTNSNFIARRFTSIGTEIKLVLTCGDSIDEIVSALNFLVPQTDIIIITGGLGPTTDDVTRDAVAKFLNVPLVQDLCSLERLEKKFVDRKRVFNTENIKQSFFPEGSIVLQNVEGTADGFCATLEGLKIYSVPGVPSELHKMFDNYIFPSIKPERQIYKKSFKIFGLPESYIGKQIRELALSSDITVSYRASMPEIEVTLKSYDLMNKDTVNKVVTAIEDEFIFSEDSEVTFPEYAANLLLEKKITLSVAESCTGGMLGSFLTNTSGISSSFIGGIISYSNDSKELLLDVPAYIIRNYGAVSKECADAMAHGCLSKFKTDYAISITGIAGPDGGSAEKPVGTFFIGIADNKNVITRKFFFNSNRGGIRKYAAYVALDVLRRKILGLRDWDYFAQG